MNSPAKYRKNVNRENRHEPTESTSSSELSDVDEDDTDIGMKFQKCLAQSFIFLWGGGIILRHQM